MKKIVFKRKNKATWYNYFYNHKNSFSVTVPTKMHEVAFLAAYNFKVFLGSIRPDPLKLACQVSANRVRALI